MSLLMNGGNREGRDKMYGRSIDVVALRGTLTT